MSISSRKLAANRANAQKSTGPQSPESKEKVALNALKHGLCGGKFQVLSCEDQDEYDDLLRRFMETEKPVDDVERELVAKMVRHTWLSERAVRLQEGCFLVQPQSPELEAAGQTGIAVRSDLDNYLRYQTTQDRAYNRAAAELAKRQKERRLQAAGFDSQKRAEAAEQRKAELHPMKVRTANARVQAHELRNLKAMFTELGPEVAQEFAEMVEKRNASVHQHSRTASATVMTNPKAA
jgi:hypothetical protein